MILGDGLLGQMMEPVEFKKEIPKISSKKDWASGVCKDRDPRKIVPFNLDPYEMEKIVNRIGNKFEKIQSEVIKEGINFTWELDSTNTLHARSIVTNTGWQILLDRGLDIFQKFEANDAFSFSNRIQKYRQCKAFYISYIKK